MSLLEEPELAEDLIQAIRDVHGYSDWQDRTGYARMDAKARYDSAMRSLGLLVNPAGGATPDAFTGMIRREEEGHRRLTSKGQEADWRWP
jgi:hypothetical protein